MIHRDSTSHCPGLKGFAANILVLDTPRHFSELCGTPVLTGKKCFRSLHNIMQGVLMLWLTGAYILVGLRIFIPLGLDFVRNLQMLLSHW